MLSLPLQARNRRRHSRLICADSPVPNEHEQPHTPASFKPESSSFVQPEDMAYIVDPIGMASDPSATKLQIQNAVTSCCRDSILTNNGSSAASRTRLSSCGDTKDTLTTTTVSDTMSDFSLGVTASFVSTPSLFYPFQEALQEDDQEQQQDQQQDPPRTSKIQPLQRYTDSTIHLGRSRYKNNNSPTFDTVRASFEKHFRQSWTERTVTIPLGEQKKLFKASSSTSSLSTFSMAKTSTNRNSRCDSGEDKPKPHHSNTGTPTKSRPMSSMTAPSSRHSSTGTTSRIRRTNKPTLIPQIVPDFAEFERDVTLESKRNNSTHNAQRGKGEENKATTSSSCRSSISSMENPWTPKFDFNDDSSLERRLRKSVQKAHQQKKTKKAIAGAAMSMMGTVEYGIDPTAAENTWTPKFDFHCSTDTEYEDSDETDESNESSEDEAEEYSEEQDTSSEEDNSTKIDHIPLSFATTRRRREDKHPKPTTILLDFRQIPNVHGLLALNRAWS